MLLFKNKLKNTTKGRIKDNKSTRYKWDAGGQYFYHIQMIAALKRNCFYNPSCWKMLVLCLYVVLNEGHRLIKQKNIFCISA